MKVGDEFVASIMQNYGLEVYGSILLSDKNKKATWQLHTSQGNKILKKVPGTEDRVRFIAEATFYLQEAGVNVPRLEKTKTGELVAAHNGSYYVVMDWIGGSKPDLGNVAETCSVLQALGQFHRDSRGFKTAIDNGTRSHLGDWPRSMQRYNERLRDFLAKARQRSDRFSELFSEQAGHFIARGEETLQRLADSAYHDWVKRVERDGNLCHQDFAPRNLRIQADGTVAVFDMDSVTFDLPARDLRKVFNKLGKKTKSWDVKIIQKLLSCYQRTNPLSRAEWEVVFLDLWYPHLFYGVISKFYEGRAPDWSEEKFIKKLQEIVRVERDKEPVLRDLFARGAEG
ncbi:MAG: CotS family spore coat protein [Syntrophomonadaceae bacterium]|nr:CotS family spore coat protein [Syntrophomonadaceae bacterium]